MNRIEKAFQCAYRKRNRLKLILILAVLFMLVLQIMMFVGNNVLLWASLGFLSVFLILIHEIMLRKKSSLHQKIKNALHYKEQQRLFFSTIEDEMRSEPLQIYEEKKDGIFIFVTKTWLVFVTPNGCLICPHKEIKGVTHDFQESRGKLRLKVNFFDKSSFVCPYEYLQDTLVELIDKIK